MGIALHFVENIASRDSTPTILQSVGVVFYLQNVSMNVCCMIGEKFFNIVAVDFKPPAVAVVGGERLEASQLSEVDPANRGPDSQSGEPTPGLAGQISA